MARRTRKATRPIQKPSREWLKLEEVLEILDVTRSTFDDWRRKGLAPQVVKLPNRQLRIERSAFDAWMLGRVQA